MKYEAGICRGKLAGNVTAAIFPKGSLPPALPFVRVGKEFDPLADAGGSRAFAALLAAAG